MKVTLVVPPSGFQLDERVYPMLGVLKVAAVLEQAAISVNVLDLSGHPLMAIGMPIFQHLYRYGESDVYGITATMPQMPAAVHILSELRLVAPAAKVILGGAHVTMVNAAARAGVARSQVMLNDLRGLFDVVVAGDGELAVFEALKPDAPFLIDADQPKTALFLTPQQVADAPWPSRHLIDLSSYHCWVDGVPATSVIAQLGCPFRCAFCGGRNSPTFRRVRLRPVADIVNELTRIVDQFGIQAFMFLDDELNVSKAYPDLLRAIARRQAERGEVWRLCGLLKSELFTEEQADLMYAAGFRKLLIGFESGDERILLNMQKNATVVDNTRAVQMAHAAGLKVKALMSLGHPGESEASITNTRDWLLDVKPDEFDATVLTIYPGTPYHDEARALVPSVWTYTAKNGDRLYFRDIDQFTDTPYYKGVPGHYQSFVWTEHLTPANLTWLRDRLEAEVRAQLQIPWPKDAAALNFEHSMGCNG
jgi:anaerobic magnesium-protoporphyrin IX monomethyl ester cyclase